ncbi:MAG: EAL domain-containing protein [Burkholderiales bacterium]|nr:EAL domain-containing protein [Burkholderiales bacterium]
MRVRWPASSLRGKLVLACVLVQLAAAALLVFGGTRLLHRALNDQAASETRQIMALLDQATAAPLAERDYAALQQMLDLLRSDSALRYLVLSDYRGQVVAASGWDAARPLPPRDAGAIDLERPDATLHAATTIRVAGQALGRVDFGLSTANLRQTKADFLARGAAIGAAAMVLSTLALAAIAMAITRHLARLSSATERVAGGDFAVHVPVSAHDEIGRLGASFNAMAAALKQRVDALQASETRERQHASAARDEQARMTTLLGAMHGGIMFVDGGGRVIYANASFCRLWALPELKAGLPLADIVPLLARQIEPADAARVEAMLDAGGEHRLGGCELHTLDGRVIVQRMQPVAQPTDGDSRIWFHDDITLERQTQQRAQQAFHDPLTGLFNRRGLDDALRAAIAQAAGSPAPLALMFIDLDDFKYANDAAGHRTGDEILVAVARALLGQMRKGELVARLGGDEFAVMCPGATAQDAGAIAGRLVTAVAGLRFEAPGQTLRVGCSIGIASFPHDARTEDDLIACADTAMYEAKQTGKNRWAAYRRDLLQVRARTPGVDWHARIQRALLEDRLVLHFQSVHRAADLRVMHSEALVRLVDENDATRLIGPADFVPHAEHSGAIRAVDRWVFEACVAQLAATEAGVCLAANLSSRSLEDAGFAGFLRDALQRHDVDPRRLHIELGATSALGDPTAAQPLLDALRGLGCAVHLDEFGNAFSSFAQLKTLAVDAVKIDGAFIRQLQAEASNRLFVASMIEIAHALGKTVIAEHVEDAETLDILRGLGVDFVQGFHFSRPSSRLPDANPRGRLQVVTGWRRNLSGDTG